MCLSLSQYLKQVGRRKGSLSIVQLINLDLDLLKLFEELLQIDFAKLNPLRLRRIVRG